MSSFLNCASDPDAGPLHLHICIRCISLQHLHKCHRLKKSIQMQSPESPLLVSRCNYPLSRCLSSPLRLFVYLCSLLSLPRRLSSSLHLPRCLSSSLYLFSFLKQSRVILCFTWICVIKCKPQKLKDLTQCSHLILMTETYQTLTIILHLLHILT